MRMCAFLSERRRLHQSAVDASIDFGVWVSDLLWIILRDNRNRFLFTVRSFEVETAAMLRRLVYRRLIHRPHRLHGEACS